MKVLLSMSLCLLSAGLPTTARAESPCLASKARLPLLIEVEGVELDPAELTTQLAAEGIYLDWAAYVRDGEDSKVFRGTTCANVRYSEIQTPGLVEITSDFDPSDKSNAPSF